MDHTAKRVYVASDNVKVARLANLSFDDKRRAREAARVVDESNEEDPFAGWTENQLRIKEANAARQRSIRAMTSDTTGESSTPTGIDWANVL